MRSWATSLTRHYPGAWMVLVGVAIILCLGFAPQAGAQDEGRIKSDEGEISVSLQSVPGTHIKRAEMTAVIDAPPEVVWQVITDLNSFKFFMPRTLTSMAISPEKVTEIVQKKPTRAEEVEKLLGPTPANPDSYRIPGGKYTVYHYSNLNLPWPCRNRWYILKGIQDEEQAAQHRYRISWSLVIGNLKENSGEWLLEPYGANQTKVRYRLSTDPGGEIPGFLVKQGTGTTLPQIIKAVREQAAKICMVR